MDNQWIVRVWDNDEDPEIIGPFDSSYEAEQVATQIEGRIALLTREESSTQAGTTVQLVMPWSDAREWVWERLARVCSAT